MGLDASVDGVVSAVAGVGGNARFEVGLDGGLAAIRGVDHAGSLLHDDATKLVLGASFETMYVKRWVDVTMEYDVRCTMYDVR